MKWHDFRGLYINSKELIHMNSIALLFFISVFSAPNKDITTQNYIEQYRELAIIEMHRTGIPASIKMAQAIHESASGMSEFALRSNNHFGIKCKSYWKGNTYFHKDDDFNKAGQLEKSCFRAYNQVLDSYIDHSNFLKDSPYYNNMFRMKDQSYESWAKALQYYGYATDPYYAEKLINIIKRYDLNSLDKTKRT